MGHPFLQTPNLVFFKEMELFVKLDRISGVYIPHIRVFIQLIQSFSIYSDGHGLQFTGYMDKWSFQTRQIIT